MFLSIFLTLAIAPVCQQTVNVKHDEAASAATRETSAVCGDVASPRFSAGEVALTRAPRRGNWVVLCANQKVLKELALAEGTDQAEDRIDLGEDSGVMVTLTGDTPVVVIETGTIDLPDRCLAAVKVRVEDQDNRGRIGWLRADWLRRVTFIASR